MVQLMQLQMNNQNLKSCSKEVSYYITKIKKKKVIRFEGEN